MVVLDFAQDMTLGKEDVGQSRPTATPIQHGWSMSQCPVLLDSGACVPIPFLMSVKALEETYLGLTINPIDPNSVSQLSAANGPPIELVGSVDLHFRFSEPSVVEAQDRKWALSGPVMQYLYPACAAIF